MTIRSVNVEPGEGRMTPLIVDLGTAFETAEPHVLSDVP
jgi:hypothetical protein